MTEGEIDSKKLTLESYLPIVRKYANVSEIIRTSPVLPIKPQIRPKGISSNYKDLLNDREFISLLYHLELFALDNIQETEKLIKISESIIEIIDSELKP